MLQLETDRLRFRQWQSADFDTFKAFYSDQEAARFVGGVQKPETAWRLMATYIGHYTLHGYSYPAIVEKATQRLIGTVGLWNSEPWPEPELGYWLLPIAQGKGYGTEAGLVVKRHAEKALQLPSLVSYIHPENEPSKKLALRLGARLDGVIELHDFGPHEVYRYW